MLIIDEIAKSFPILTIVHSNAAENILVRKIEIKNKALEKKIFLIKYRGIIFWTVDRRIIIKKGLVFIMIINHIWNGGVPNFISIATVMIRWALLNNISLVIKAVKNKIDAHLWTRKYFILFSIERLLSDDMIGKNLRRFSSNATQINKIDVELIEINKDMKISK